MGNVICNIDITLRLRNKATKKRIQRAWLLSNKTLYAAHHIGSWWSNEICTSYSRTFFLSPTKPTLLYAVVLRSKILLSYVAFCDFTHCRMVVSSRRLGTTYWFHIKGFDPWPLSMGPIRCLETLVRNYHFALRKIPKERRFHLHRGGRMKSRVIYIFFS